MTEEQKKYKRDKNRERHAALVAMGRCAVCGKNKADDGYKTCLVCRMDRRAESFDRYHNKKKSTEAIYKYETHWKRRVDVCYAFGVCVKCQKRNAQPGSVTCLECKLKQRRRAEERRRKSGATPLEILAYPDRCSICGSEDLQPGKKLCKKHYEIAKNNMLNARKYKTKENDYFRILNNSLFKNTRK